MEVTCPHCKKKFDLKLKCNRCGHEWIPRDEKPPKVCPNPKCKSPYWNKERVRKLVDEPKTYI
jgi:hypothetical protein